MPTDAITNAPGLIEAGKPGAAFSLKDQGGNTHKLSDYRGRWVVLYFYPRDNTPGCTIQACGFRDSHEALAGYGAVVLGVSPDDRKSHQRFAERRGLCFPLLIDPDQQIATKYGVWRQKSLFGKKYMGIIRTTYLIDPGGKVVRRWDKVKVAGHVAEVVAVLAEHE
jgi:thioredoxin-dependent peroxiredoxin